MTPLAPRVVSTGFGLLMAATPAVGSDRPVATAAAAVAVCAVLVAVVFRTVATGAVLLAAAVIALGDATPLIAAVSGLFAAGYLVARHTLVVTTATLIAAAGFAVVGLAATAFPLRVPWMPVLAPPAAFACYVLAIRPFLGDRASATAVRSRPPRR